MYDYYKAIIYMNKELVMDYPACETYIINRLREAIQIERLRALEALTKVEDISVTLIPCGRSTKKKDKGRE